MRKSKLFDGSKPRLALYSSLISHFCTFWKKLKNQCQNVLQKFCFLIKKNEPWPPQGRLILQFLSIFGDSKIRCFFYFASEAPKIRKCCPKCHKKDPGCQRPITFGRQGPQGGPARDQKSGNVYQENRKQGKRKGRGMTESAPQARLTLIPARAVP